MSNRIRVVAGGDCSPIGINEEAFSRGDASAAFGTLLPIFSESDLSIVNLESPLTAGGSAINKGGPALKASSETLRGLKAAGIGLLGLANNHIMDWGPQGLMDTLNSCREAGIGFVGAGENTDEAERLFFFRKNGISLAVMAVAENEYSIAEPDYPGAAPADPIRMKRTIDRNREKFDHLLVLYHGGNEYFPYPSPYLREQCRFLIECGAACVLCQHSHIIGCGEHYRDGYILYGQGNLLFDFSSTKECWYRGLVTTLEFDAGKLVSVNWIPVTQSPRIPGVDRMDAETAKTVTAEFQRRSEEIASEEFLSRRWVEFCRGRQNLYFGLMLGFPRLLHLLNRFGWVTKLYSRSALRNIGNLFRCDAHRNVALTLFHEDLAARRIKWTSRAEKP